MISNDVLMTRRITYPYVLWNNSFTMDEIDQINTICGKGELKKAVTIGKGEDCDDHRRSSVKFFDRDEETSWIFERFNRVIETINNTYYGFDLYGYDNFQYTVYDSSINAMYDWHMDTLLGGDRSKMGATSTRKLSIVMLLSEPNVEFSGGEFAINQDCERNAYNIELHKGQIIAFPSFVIHKVNPVHLGVRKSLVIWVEGPKFR